MHSKTGRSANPFLPVAAIALIALSAVVLSACANGTPANTWVQPNQNAQNTRYVGGRITTNTINVVAVGWTADQPTAAGIGATAPSPYITQNNVFVQAPGGRAVALDLATGQRNPAASLVANAVSPAWLRNLKAAVKSKIGPTFSPILTNGGDNNESKIVVGAAGGRVGAFNLSDGSSAWSAQIKSPTNTTARVISNMAAAHDNIYVPVANVPSSAASLSGEALQKRLQNRSQGKSNNNGQLVAISTSNGKVSWTKKLASVPFGAATVVNNVVFTSTLDGHVYGFNAGNGDQVFESSLPAGAVAPTAAFDGTLIVPAGFVWKRGQKAQVVAFTIGGMGEIGGAAAPKIKKQSAGAVAKSAAPAASAAAPAAAAANGKTLFTQNCAGCHTLKAAGTSGTVGPNLDQLKPSDAAVVKQVTNGGGGMPAFKGQLSPAEIAALGKYVSSVAGK